MKTLDSDANPQTLFEARSSFKALTWLGLAAALSGCTTIKHTAVDRLGDALAAGGTTFSADDDPQLIAAATPFSLKLMESLLAERPQHRGLLSPPPPVSPSTRSPSSSRTPTSSRKRISPPAPY